MSKVCQNFVANSNFIHNHEFKYLIIISKNKLYFIRFRLIFHTQKIQVSSGNVDQKIEASLELLIDMAVEGNADIELQLQGPSYLGTFTIKRLVYLTKQVGWEGRVSISHAFGLADVSTNEAYGVTEMLRDAGVTIVTCVPIGKVIFPILLLDESGVKIAIGIDNIYDSWWPTGIGDVRERAGLLMQHYR